VSAGAPGAQRGVPLSGRCTARPIGREAGRGVLAVPVAGRRAAGRSRPLAGVGWTPGGWRQVRGPRGGEASRSARRPVRGAPPPGWRAGRASRASGRSRHSCAVRALEGGPRADRRTTAVRPTFRRAKQGQRPGPSACVGPCEARRAGPERAAQPPKNGGASMGVELRDRSAGDVNVTRVTFRAGGARGVTSHNVDIMRGCPEPVGGRGQPVTSPPCPAGLAAGSRAPGPASPAAGSRGAGGEPARGRRYRIGSRSRAKAGVTPGLASPRAEQAA